MIYLPLWAKLLACELSQFPIVRGVRLFRDHISVRYATGSRERYYVVPRNKYGPLDFYIKQNDSVIKIIKPEPAYEPNPNSVCNHWGIKRRRLNKASFISKRLSVHQLLQRISDDSHQQDEYPESCVRRDIASLQSIDCSRFWRGDTIDFFASIPSKPACWRLLEHFFPDQEALAVEPLRKALFRILRKHHPITTEYVRRYARWFCGKKRINPFAYCALLSHISAGSTVLDLNPTGGHKAVACGLLGLKYRVLDATDLSIAASREIDRLLRLDWGMLGDEQVTVTIADGDLQAANLHVARPYLSSSKHLLGWCGVDEIGSLELPNPKTIIGAHTKSRSPQPNGYFLWW